jgi:hypothetical protein
MKLKILIYSLLILPFFSFLWRFSLITLLFWDLTCLICTLLLFLLLLLSFNYGHLSCISKILEGLRVMLILFILKHRILDQNLILCIFISNTNNLNLSFEYQFILQSFCIFSLMNRVFTFIILLSFQILEYLWSNHFYFFMT